MAINLMKIPMYTSNNKSIINKKPIFINKN